MKRKNPDTSLEAYKQVSPEMLSDHHSKIIKLPKTVVRDLTGQRFGRLIAIKQNGRNKEGRVLWNCVCDCGNITTIVGHSLVRGASNSCGCLRKELVLKKNLTHGQSFKDKTTKEFTAWMNIKNRCYNINNKSYKNYGGRGIKICDRWLNSFENFYSDMGESPSSSHSLDRYPNNDGDYEPTNCRWATLEEQAGNKRNNRWLQNGKQKMILSEWATLLATTATNIDRMLKKKSFSQVVEYYKNTKKTHGKKKSRNFYRSIQSSK